MNKLLLLLMGAALCLLVSCTTTRMALTNPAWDNNTGYLVEGRTQTVFQKKPLRFGEFYTTQVKTSWRQSLSVTTDMNGRLTERNNKTLGMLYEKSKSSRKFSLSNGKGEEALVLTFNQLNSSSYLVGGGVDFNFNWINKALGMPSKMENAYYVQVYEPDNDKPWELVLDMDAIEMNPKNYAGYFALDESQYYTIRPIRHVMGKNGPVKVPVGLVGFEVSNVAGDAVAAVSIFDKGLVYLQDNLTPGERFLMADLCAALLLYEPTEVAQ
ncbi:hypothetical protein [Mucilaginibacter terrae]|uniref:Lipoprotein n=1 Tax=Mucilaginibacter terrae TaxID=1955052 RepID=A0ABU3GYU6_9SPHI|nr:hypothetical protein [Mucilaginibacter terrae]MDT3404944.1 hypothetical protein [Mucilaginibacter terrae]